MNERSFIESFLKTNAAYVVARYHDKGLLTVTSKGDPGDLLTDVDLTIQKRFIDAVGKAFPDDIVVGEENGYDVAPPTDAARVWVIDPIDGTYNFVRGINPAFAISIAFVQDGYAQAAGVVMPLNGHFFLAESGAGSFQNGRRLKVSAIQHLSESCIEIDFSSLGGRRALVRSTADLLAKAGQIRCLGSAVAGICQVATGDAEGYLHRTLPPWDFAAAQLIAEEADAMATRLDGSPLRMFDGKEGVLITNGAIHATLLGLLSK